MEEMTNNYVRLACVLLAFRNIDVLKSSLESIISEKETLRDSVVIDIYVVENFSQFTETVISPYVKQLVDQGILRGYLKFSENITNNAIDIALSGELFDYGTYDFVVVTDGDIVVPNGVVSEQVNILKSCDEVMACALNIDSTTWNVTKEIQNIGVELERKTKQSLESAPSLPYIVQGAGVWFVMFRSKELAELVEFSHANQLRFLDITYRQIVGVINRRLWVTTKESIGRELHREVTLWPSYTQDRDEIKRKFVSEGWAKTECPPVLFQHKRAANAELYMHGEWSLLPAVDLGEVNPIKVDSYDNDSFFNHGKYVVSKMADRGLPLVFSQTVPKAVKPGVYMIRKGINASFYWDKYDAFFIQMRGGYSIPPLANGIFSVVDAGKIFEIIHARNVDVSWSDLLSEMFALVKVGGYLKLPILHWNALLKLVGENDVIKLRLVEKLLIRGSMRKREQIVCSESFSLDLLDSIFQAYPRITVGLLKEILAERGFDCCVENEENLSPSSLEIMQDVRIYKNG